MTVKTFPTDVDFTGVKDMTAKVNPFLNALVPGDVLQWPDFGKLRVDLGIKTPNQTGITHEVNGTQVFSNVDRPYGSWVLNDVTITNGRELYSPSASFTSSMGNAYILNADDVQLNVPGWPYYTSGIITAKYVDAHHALLNRDVPNATGKRLLISAFANRGRSLWEVHGGSELLWRNIGMRGSNETANAKGIYDYSLEAQACMSFTGVVRDFEIDTPDFRYPWGDTVYVGGGGDGTVGYVHGGTLANTGRMAIGLSGYSDLRVVGVLMAATRRTIIDVEPNTPSNSYDRCGHLRVEGAVFGSHGLSVFSSGGQPNQVGLTEFVGCCAKGAQLNMLFRGGNAAHRRGPYVIRGCSSDTMYDTPRKALFDMEWMVGATVRDNSAPFRAGGGMHLVRIENSLGAPYDVGGNTTPGGTELLFVS